MRVLVDTNVLLRAQQHGHPHHQAATDALACLAEAGNDLCICAQNVIEFWVVATRPENVNGFGWSAEDTARAVAGMVAQFTECPEPADMLAKWQHLVTTFKVIGVRAHDARLVALMLAQGIDHVLTFNAADFSWHPAIQCLDPFQEASVDRQSAD